MVSEPPGKSPSTNWTADVSRVRRLQTVQLIILSLLGIGVIVGGLVLGSRILDAQRTVERDQVQARELHRIRGELRQAYAQFLERRAAGKPGIDQTTTAVFATGLADINRLRSGALEDAQARAAVGRLDRALGQLGGILSRDYSQFAIGSPQDLAVLRQSVGVISEIDAAALTWANRATALADDHQSDLQGLTRQLMWLLAGLVALGGLAGLLIAGQLARLRTRIVDALFAEHAARGAVIASVQDGLAVLGPGGRILDMNERLSSVTGYDEQALRGATDGVPYLDGTGLDPHVVGEHDLQITRPDGTRVPVILSSSPLTSAGAEQGRVHVLKDVTERKRAETELRSLAMEQAALRRAATAVASGADPADVFTIVAREIALLLGASGGMVSRFDRTTDRAMRVGAWLDPSVRSEMPPRLPLEDNVVSIVYRSGIAARTEDLTDPPADIFARHGFPVSISAPVRVGSDIWGAVTAVAADPATLPTGSEVRLARFAELVGITVANADARAGLARLAATDALTGLANHRTFHERLRNELHAARANSTPLSLVLMDLDHFKAVNDAYGHQTGDSVLAAFGRCLAAGARYEELVARIGGEEFAWVLPGSDATNAARAAQRVAETFGAIEHPGVGRLTVSAGVCDLQHTHQAEELIRLADAALYWSKSHGRNTVTRYRPEVVRELSDTERAARHRESQAKTALRTLTRLIDTKDPATARHAERVAAMAAQIAHRLDWPNSRVAMIEEAGLFHDVGKIVIPDELLFKTAPLSAEERERVESHVELGAEIVGDVLDPEQVAWIRGHHEKWDGTGYPDGLQGHAIPLGAQILHLADAWDAMTSGRLYQSSRTPDEAIAECRAMAGSQFSAELVSVLVEIVTEHAALRDHAASHDVLDEIGATRDGPSIV